MYKMFVQKTIYTSPAVIPKNVYLFWYAEWNTPEVIIQSTV